MEGRPRQSESQAPTIPSRQSRTTVKCIAIVILTLIVLIGLAILIIWLTIKPKRLNYSVETASIQRFEMNQNQLNASFNFEVRAENPSSRVSVYYDSITATVGFEDQDLAFGVIDPFYQPHRDVRRFDVNFATENISIHNTILKDLVLEKSAGEIDLDLWIKARIRFKVGVWKSRHRTLRVRCSPVVVYFSKAKSFKKTTCLTEI